ncbi:MAG: hypothetical protein ACPKPY_10840 [Nitrososphaeraceae archaeon]
MHGFRKFFKTTCEQLEMRSINIEILLGHNIGVSSSYYKPKEQEVLNDFLKANGFIINEENRLKSKITEMKDKEKVQDYIINKKMMEKDRQIEGLQQSIEKNP